MLDHELLDEVVGSTLGDEVGIVCGGVVNTGRKEEPWEFCNKEAYAPACRVTCCAREVLPFPFPMVS